MLSVSLDISTCGFVHFIGTSYGAGPGEFLSLKKNSFFDIYDDSSPKLLTNGSRCGLSKIRLSDQGIFDTPRTFAAPSIPFLVYNSHTGFVDSLEKAGNRFIGYRMHYAIQSKSGQFELCPWQWHQRLDAYFKFAK